MSPRRSATREDVAACYRFILGRKPENEAVLDHALADHPNLWTVIERFLSSLEAQRRQEVQAAERIRYNQDPSSVETVADPAALAGLVEHIQTIWSRYGDEDAYYSVLTNPSFHADRITDHEVEAFYATGETEVVQFERVCARNNIKPTAKGAVLELGCGVGRMGEAFRRRFDEYIGVDISAGHLALARDRFQSRGIGRVLLKSLRDYILHPVDYDLFYSVLVLQHNPPPIITNLLSLALGRLRPGGLAYFQVPCFLYDYHFSVEAYLRGEGRKEEMEMHALPQKIIFDLLAKHGLVPIEVTLDPQIGPIGYSYCFLAKKGEAVCAADDLTDAAQALSLWTAVPPVRDQPHG